MALYSTKTYNRQGKSTFPSRPGRPVATEHKGPMRPCRATMITRHAIRANASTHPPNRPLPCLARRIWERSPFTCRTFPGQMPLHHSLLPIPRSRSSPQKRTFPIAVGPSRVWRGAQGSGSMVFRTHGQDFRHFPARSMGFRTPGQVFRHFPARSMVFRSPIRIIFKFPLRKLKKSYFMACFRRLIYVCFAYYCSSKYL